MTLRQSGASIGAALVVGATGCLLSTLPFGRPHDALAAVFAIAGIGGSVLAATGRAWAVTMVAATAVFHLAVTRADYAAGTIVVTAALSLFLAAAEIADTGRWRLGWRVAFAAHIDYACAAIVAASAVLLAGGLRPSLPARASTAVTMLGMLAAAALIVAVGRPRERGSSSPSLEQNRRTDV